jgi:hypothetical protein
VSWYLSIFIESYANRDINHALRQWILKRCGTICLFCVFSHYLFALKSRLFAGESDRSCRGAWEWLLVGEVRLEEAVLLPSLDPDPVDALFAVVALDGAVVGFANLNALTALRVGKVAAQHVGSLNNKKICQMVLFGETFIFCWRTLKKQTLSGWDWGLLGTVFRGDGGATPVATAGLDTVVGKSATAAADSSESFFWGLGSNAMSTEPAAIMKQWYKAI